MSQVNTVTIESQEAITTPTSIYPTISDRSKPVPSRYNTVPEAKPRTILDPEFSIHSEEAKRPSAETKSITFALQNHPDSTDTVSDLKPPSDRKQSERRPVDGEAYSTSTASEQALTRAPVTEVKSDDDSSTRNSSASLNESGPPLVDQVSPSSPPVAAQDSSPEVVPPQSNEASNLQQRARVVSVLRHSLPKGRSEYVRDVTGLVRRVEQEKIEGGCSTVYIGELENNKVAIKSIRGNNKDRQHVIYRRFWREIWTWWCLDHENVLHLFGFVASEEFGNYPAMISPWCDNGNAKEYLQQNPGMSHRVGVFHDMTKGIKYLHEHKPAIAHGDLKPNNILVDAEGTAKLCDFGLVRLIHEIQTGTTTTTSHTGSARYLSPELLTHDKANEDEAEESPDSNTQDGASEDEQEDHEEIFRSNQASDIFAVASVGMELLYDFAPYSRISGRNRPDYHISNAIINGEQPAIRPAGLSGQGLTGVLCELWDTFEWSWKYNSEERPEAGDVCGFLDRSHDALVEKLGLDHGRPTSKARKRFG